MFKFFVVTLLVLCLAACNQSNEPSTQTLRLNIYTEPPSLDSRKATDSTSMNVLIHLFEGLTRIDKDHQPHPAIAEKIMISQDRRVYTFKLRKTFWTNGEQVTADDFVYAWQTILNPSFPSLFAYKLFIIENAKKIKEGKLPMQFLGVRAQDPLTLEVTLKHPTPYFLELLAFPTFFPVNKRIDQKNPEWAADAGLDYVSNGPFQLKKWEHENEIIATKNPGYWDACAVKLDALHCSMIDDTTTEFYMFEMDELDWAGSPISNLPPEFITAFQEDAELRNKLSVQFYPATATYYYKINTLHYPLGNINIRKALSYTISRKDIVEHITQAGQIPATALVPSMPGWTKTSNLFEDGNTKLAQQLFAKGLEELNITLNEFPTLNLSYNNNLEHQKIAQAIQQQWKESLGIEVQLQHFDWKVHLTKISKQDYQIGRMGWIGDFHDPVSFLDPFKFRDDPGGGNNATGWESAEYIFYLDQAEKEIDPLARATLLQKAEALLISEMPIIPIYFIMNGYLKKPYVQGVYLSSLGMIDFKHAFIKT